MKRALTEFGKEMRVFRVGAGERLTDMAGKLGISAAYLSAIEIGVRDAPGFLIPRLKEAYGLGDDFAARLDELREMSARKAVIGLSGATGGQKKLAALFCRAFRELTGAQCGAIEKILKEAEKGRLQDRRDDRREEKDE